MEKFDGNTIFHHVTNDTHQSLYEFAIWGIDLSITKHVLMLWIVSLFCVVLAVYATRNYRRDKQAKPKGISHLFEILIEFIKSDIVIPNIGEKGYKTWTPLIATFFLFILIGNYLGLIPFFEKLLSTFELHPYFPEIHLLCPRLQWIFQQACGTDHG